MMTATKTDESDDMTKAIRSENDGVIIYQYLNSEWVMVDKATLEFLRMKDAEYYGQSPLNKSGVDSDPTR
jgi:hypothetical protein